VVYPDGVWYSITSREDVDRVIDDHLVAGGRAAGLLLPQD
jgi:(2Fe-2S) ferredoxin